MNTLTACGIGVLLFLYMGITTFVAWRRRPRANLLTAVWLVVYVCGALLGAALYVALLVGHGHDGHLSSWQAVAVWGVAAVAAVVASDALVRGVNGARALLRDIRG